MNDIRFACPHCGQHVVCDFAYCDVSIECPSCSQTMVVPRLTPPESSRSGAVILASTSGPKPGKSPPIPVASAWTEAEWAKHSQGIVGREDGKMPAWVIGLFGTLVLAFILKVHAVSLWPILASLVLGAAITAGLMAKGLPRSGARAVLSALTLVVAVLFLLPVVALGILFVGCGGCK